jgi:hypothetical protein
MKWENYYLDLESLQKLGKSDRERIHSYYIDMMNYFSDQRERVATSIFHTLNQGGYLKEIRNENLEKILS